MTVAFIRAGNRRKKYKPRGSARQAAPVETGATTPYNRSLKSKSFRVAASETLGPLEPLRSGKPVTLKMDVERSPLRPKSSQPHGPLVVVIVPGAVLRQRADCFLVSVIGKGSNVVTPYHRSSVGRLMLAGMPKRLAEFLMNQLRRILDRRV